VYLCSNQMASSETAAAAAAAAAVWEVHGPYPLHPADSLYKCSIDVASPSLLLPAPPPAAMDESYPTPPVSNSSVPQRPSTSATPTSSSYCSPTTASPPSAVCVSVWVRARHGSDFAGWSPLCKTVPAEQHGATWDGRESTGGDVCVADRPDALQVLACTSSCYLPTQLVAVDHVFEGSSSGVEGRGSGVNNVEARGSGMEGRCSGVAGYKSRSSGIESRSSGIEGRGSGIESRSSGIESRSSGIEGRGSGVGAEYGEEEGPAVLENKPAQRPEGMQLFKVSFGLCASSADSCQIFCSTYTKQFYSLKSLLSCR